MAFQGKQPKFEIRRQNDKTNVQKLFKNYLPSFSFNHFDSNFIANEFRAVNRPGQTDGFNKRYYQRQQFGGLSDEKTYYYAFNVKRGTLTLTLDLIPANKSDAGGYLQWTLLNAKFARLKEDVLPLEKRAKEKNLLQNYLYFTRKKYAGFNRADA